MRLEHPVGSRERTKVSCHQDIEQTSGCSTPTLPALSMHPPTSQKEGKLFKPAGVVDCMIQKGRSCVRNKARMAGSCTMQDQCRRRRKGLTWARNHPPLPPLLSVPVSHATARLALS
jgi:hypothetical protein